ncbi:MAG TPA: hypothetical protein VGM82_22290 [Gemmatimonadaceae bacterium]|jgi:hypothetical protein
MRTHILKALGIAGATMALATAAQAQSRYQDRGRDQHHGDQHDDRRGEHQRTTVIHRANGDVLLVPRNHVPPGLAKKPLGLPPGQFRKHYTTLQGANSLSNVLRRNGFRVDRVSTSGNSRIVYYRGRDGVLHRALVSPGTNELGFSNVPSPLVDQVRGILNGGR